MKLWYGIYLAMVPHIALASPTLSSSKELILSCDEGNVIVYFEDDAYRMIDKKRHSGSFEIAEGKKSLIRSRNTLEITEVELGVGINPDAIIPIPTITKEVWRLRVDLISGNGVYTHYDNGDLLTERNYETCKETSPEG